MARTSPAWSRRFPACSGLRPTYISAQLGAWRYGTRTAIAPDCMQIVGEPPDRGRRQGGGRVAVVAAGAGRSVARRRKGSLRMPLRLRQRAAMRKRPSCRAPGSYAFAGLCRGVRRPRKRVTARTQPADVQGRRSDRQGRVSRARRRLRRLPHRAERQAVRRRPRRCRRRSARSTRPTSRPTTRPASASGPPTSSTG